MKRVWQINTQRIKNTQNRNRLTDKKELKSIEATIAKDRNIEKYEMIVYTSKIQVALYDDEIMVMHNGIPTSMSELSPIQTEGRTRDKLYIFADKSKQEFTKEYMLENYNVKSESIE